MHGTAFQSLLLVKPALAICSLTVTFQFSHFVLTESWSFVPFDGFGEEVGEDGEGIQGRRRCRRRRGGGARGEGMVTRMGDGVEGGGEEEKGRRW